MGMEWGGFEGGRGNHLAEGGGWHSEGREKVGESSGWGTHGGPRGGGGAAGTVRMVHLRAQSVFIHVIRAI